MKLTLLGAAHAISKNWQKFQNRIPRESNQNFDIPTTNHSSTGFVDENNLWDLNISRYFYLK